MYIGIDGYKKSWICASIDNSEILIVTKHSKLTTMLDKYEKKCCKILIDIPIGLSNNGVRACDSDAKIMLGKNNKRVFHTISRNALTLWKTNVDKQKVKAQSLQDTNEILTDPAFGLLTKIQEVDQYILNNSQSNVVQSLAESHPEICFLSLNNNVPVASKHHHIGIVQRINILNRYIPDFSKNFMSNNSKYPQVPTNDILDAIVLALTAKLMITNKVNRYFPNNNQQIDPILNRKITMEYY